MSLEWFHTQVNTVRALPKFFPLVPPSQTCLILKHPCDSWLWDVPQIQTLAAQPRTAWALADACILGSPCRNWTLFLVGNVDSRDLHRIARRCWNWWTLRCVRTKAFSSKVFRITLGVFILQATTPQGRVKFLKHAYSKGFRGERTYCIRLEAQCRNLHGRRKARLSCLRCRGHAKRALDWYAPAGARARTMKRRK